MATVFWYKVYDPASGGMRKAPQKATPDAIHSVGGEKIWGSAQEVPDALIDCHGFYVPPSPAVRLSEHNQALVQRILPKGLAATPSDDPASVALFTLKVEIGALDVLIDAARQEGWRRAMSGLSAIADPGAWEPAETAEVSGVDLQTG